MRFPILKPNILLALALLASSSIVHGQSGHRPPIAIVGGTLIDGNGGPPVTDAAILIEGAKIAAVGRNGTIKIPDEAQIIDAAGKFIVPGFIDSNVHLSLYGGNTNARYESLVRYQHRQADLVLESAQLQLKYGITTVRDSYGVLPPLLKIRDAIATGKQVGPRMLVAGNIVGWGGPFSITFSLIAESELTLFQEQMNDLISQGAGEDLMDLTPEELRGAIDAYLDKGPDFIKYGGTGHFTRPVLIGFSPDAQKVMVEETHRRGRLIETHSTSIEGLRLSIMAGIDLIQHPEILTPREMPDDLVQLIVERKIICCLLTNTMTGDAWQRHLRSKELAAKRIADAGDATTGHSANPLTRPRSSAEIRHEKQSLGEGLEVRRRNAIKLIKAGATVTIGTDNYLRVAPEFARAPKPENQNHGIGSIIAIEGLVELGMTPAQALVSVTKHGAMACNALDLYGTLEEGKDADLLILGADPLKEIRNIRTLETVMKEGRIIDHQSLPEAPVFYRHPGPETSRK